MLYVDPGRRRTEVIFGMMFLIFWVSKHYHQPKSRLLCRALQCPKTNSVLYVFQPPLQIKDIIAPTAESVEMLPEEGLNGEKYEFLKSIHCFSFSQLIQ